MSNARELSKVFLLSPLRSLVSQLAAVAGLAPHVSTLSGIAEQGAMPTGAAMIWTRPNLPEGWIWGDGRVLLPDTEYQALRAAYIADGFPHGDDGNGNPRIPDARGRTTASPDDMGGTAAGRLSLGGLGASGGVEEVTLTSTQSGTPSHSHTASSTFSNGVAASAGAHSHTLTMQTGESSGSGLSEGSASSGENITTNTAGAHTHTVTGTVTTTVSAADPQNASEAHTNVQPTLVLPLIVKT